MSETIGFGTFQTDNDEDLKKKNINSFSFGLNEKVVLTSFEYVKDDNEYFTAEFQKEDGGVMNFRKFNPLLRIFGKNGEITDTKSEEYITNFNKTMKNFKGAMTHYLKLFYTEEELKAAFATPLNSYEEYIKKCASLLSKGILAKTPIDVFCQYQYTLKSDKTYLEIPDKLFDGAFLCPHIAPVGKWEAVREWVEIEDGKEYKRVGLAYKDQAGNLHKFKRDKEFMESNRARQQTATTTANATAMNETSAPIATWED